MSGDALERRAQCWRLVRRDGQVLGFTDHDTDLAFEGTVFRATTGWTARALSQTTGLSVDNSEALGGLSDEAITEADLVAGRYDGAQLEAWRLDWANVDSRSLIFRGTLGEIARAGGAFQAELRGLAEALNQPTGRVYQRRCLAVLGDARCGVDLATHQAEGIVRDVATNTALAIEGAASFAAGWFDDGILEVVDGAGAGLRAAIHADRLITGGRRIDLWAAPGAALVPGVRVRVVAGCDRLADTCKAKFANFANFRGFPHVPSEDFLMAYPVSGGANDGQSRQR